MHGCAIYFTLLLSVDPWDQLGHWSFCLSWSSWVPLHSRCSGTLTHFSHIQNFFSNFWSSPGVQPAYPLLYRGTKSISIPLQGYKQHIHISTGVQPSYWCLYMVTNNISMSLPGYNHHIPAPRWVKITYPCLYSGTKHISMPLHGYKQHIYVSTVVQKIYPCLYCGTNSISMPYVLVTTLIAKSLYSTSTDCSLNSNSVFLENVFIITCNIILLIDNL